MQINSEDMFKVRELVDLCEAFKDYVDEDRQILIMLNMNRRGIVYAIEFNKDLSWAAPFVDMEIPLSFIPLHLFTEYNFSTYFYIEEKQDD